MKTDVFIVSGVTQPHLLGCDKHIRGGVINLIAPFAVFHFGY